MVHACISLKFMKVNEGKKIRYHIDTHTDHQKAKSL